MKNKTIIFPWYRIWLMTVTQPRSQTFEKIISQTPASFRRAYDWAFIGSWGFAAVFLTFTRVFSIEEASRPFPVSSEVMTKGLTIFFSGLFFLIGFMLLGMLIQLIAHLLGGQGTREHLMYAMGAYWAPLGLITGLIGVLTFNIYIVFGLILYGVILNTMVTKAAHQFDWGRAIMTNFIIFFPLCSCAVMAYLDPFSDYIIYQGSG